jgi:pentatricopeptide repeat protein
VRPQWLSTRVTDPYAVLGLPHGATEDRVKRAYYKLALRLHPDRHPGTPDALQRFTEVGDAYTAIQGGAGGQARKCRSEHAEELERMEQAPHVDAFPPWAHRLAVFLHHAGGERLDRWLMPSYSRIVYERVKAGELTEAFDVLEEMKGEGEVPSHAVYEMLIRGCTIAMRRVGPGEQGDHLTQNLIGRVGELWADMEAMGRKPDYKTYNELIRAYGKAGRIKELMVLFEHMCDGLWLRVVAF